MQGLEGLEEHQAKHPPGAVPEHRQRQEGADEVESPLVGGATPAVDAKSPAGCPSVEQALEQELERLPEDEPQQQEEQRPDERNAAAFEVSEGPKEASSEVAEHLDGLRRLEDLDRPEGQQEPGDLVVEVEDEGQVPGEEQEPGPAE